MKLKTVKDIKYLKNKSIFVRCDFDVPLKKNGSSFVIADDSRLQAALPTINYLIKKKARLILAGHLGRPDGKLISDLSLRPIHKYFEQKLNAEIEFITDFTKRKKNSLPKLSMFENLRFWLGEKKNDLNFAKNLSSLADLFVNESFAVSHRAEASVAAIQDFLPSYAGLHFTQEINFITKILSHPSRPLTIIIGGAKIETKLPIIERFLTKADYILVGGGVANNFFDALAFEMGDSLVNKKYLKESAMILAKSEKGLLAVNQQPTDHFLINLLQTKITNTVADLKWIKTLRHKIILPIDVKLSNSKIRRINQKPLTPTNQKILDIGPQTIKLYSRIIKNSRSIIWNGPLGFFEDEEFGVGTNSLAKSILNSRAKSIIGGGETAEAVKQLQQKIPDRVFISTGGGAMLEFLAGKELPALRTIKK